jgi:hypothetical protein
MIPGMKVRYHHLGAFCSCLAITCYIPGGEQLVVESDFGLRVERFGCYIFMDILNIILGRIATRRVLTSMSRKREI